MRLVPRPTTPRFCTAPLPPPPPPPAAVPAAPKPSLSSPPAPAGAAAAGCSAASPAGAAPEAPPPTAASCANVFCSRTMARGGEGVMADGPVTHTHVGACTGCQVQAACVCPGKHATMPPTHPSAHPPTLIMFLVSTFWAIRSCKRQTVDQGFKPVSCCQQSRAVAESLGQAATAGCPANYVAPSTAGRGAMLAWPSGHRQLTCSSTTFSFRSSSSVVTSSLSARKAGAGGGRQLARGGELNLACSFGGRVACLQCTVLRPWLGWQAARHLHAPATPALTRLELLRVVTLCGGSQFGTQHLPPQRQTCAGGLHGSGGVGGSSTPMRPGTPGRWAGKRSPSTCQQCCEQPTNPPTCTATSAVSTSPLNCSAQQRLY
jgi:hypothetical protein